MHKIIHFYADTSRVGKHDFLEKMWLKNRGILVSQYDIKMFFYDYVQYNNVIH